MKALIHMISNQIKHEANIVNDSNMWWWWWFTR